MKVGDLLLLNPKGIDKGSDLLPLLIVKIVQETWMDQTYDVYKCLTSEERIEGYSISFLRLYYEKATG